MTTVTYDRGNFAIDIRGHAGCGKAGQDLVCSAVSILMWTLVDCVMPEADFGARWIKKEDVPLSAVRCYPDKRLTKRCRVIMDTIADGFQLLAAHYPQYVSYKQTGGADNDA